MNTQLFVRTQAINIVNGIFVQMHVYTLPELAMSQGCWGMSSHRNLCEEKSVSCECRGGQHKNQDLITGPYQRGIYLQQSLYKCP